MQATVTSWLNTRHHDSVWHREDPEYVVVPEVMGGDVLSELQSVQDLSGALPHRYPDSSLLPPKAILFQSVQQIHVRHLVRPGCGGSEHWPPNTTWRGQPFHRTTTEEANGLLLRTIQPNTDPTEEHGGTLVPL